MSDQANAYDQSNVQGQHALSLSRFSFSYPGGKPVVDNLTWNVDSGTFTLLVGATGSGKTTLLRCIKPEIAPAGKRVGELRVFGREPEKSDGYDATLEVGYVSQDPQNQLVCDTVWHELAFGLENLGLSNNEMNRRVAEVAHFFGIEPWINRKTHELSGGQAQMVNLAAVLAMRPRLLLLDEPTSQLDPVASKNFAHALFRINRELGMTVIVATHEPEIMAEYATNCVTIQDGKLVESSCDDFASGVNAWPSVKMLAASWLSEACGCDSGLRESLVHRGGLALSLHDAFMRYSKDGDWILSGFDASFNQGAISAVVGGNGCGKSTFLRVAAGVVKIERGKMNAPLRSSQVLLPQDPKALFVCDTVAQELEEWRSGCGYSEDDIDAILDDFGLSGKKESHPYDLSGGQQQLLALAKLLLTNPRLLLLDEPSKGLDAHTKAIVAVKLRECANEGASVIMATHDLPFASLVCDSIAMMFDGRCACMENADEFFEDNLFYKPMPDGFSRYLASMEMRAADNERVGISGCAFAANDSLTIESGIA